MIFIISSFLLRVLISIYNVFYGPIPGAEFDALSFHYEAIQFSNYLSDRELGLEVSYDYKIGWYYSNFLGLIYNYFENNRLLIGSLLSCVFWLFSSIIFYHIVKIFTSNRLKVNLLLFAYCWLFPTSIIYNSITLREPYILFILNFLILNFVILYFKKFNILNFIFLIIALIPFSLLHDANIIFTAVFTFILSYLFFIEKVFGKEKKLFLFILSIFFLFIFIEIFRLPLNEIIFDKIAKYRYGHFADSDMARAFYTSKNYIKSLDYNLLIFIKFVSNNFVDYMFQPFPWMITSVKDFLLVFENCFRLIFIAMMFINLFKFDTKKDKYYSVFIILLIAFFLMEFIYSQATINWGTASRHHSVSITILLILSLISNKDLKKTTIK